MSIYFVDKDFINNCHHFDFRNDMHPAELACVIHSFNSCKEPHTSQRLSFLQMKAIGQTELNTSNPEEVLQLAAQKRKKRFLQAMAKLYF